MLSQEPDYDENNQSINLLDLEVTFYLDGRLNIEQRTRYNVWALLGDVGGFREGIYLVLELFIGSYSALAFQVSLLTKMTVKRQSERENADENLNSYQNIIA